jgi:hypothetical protein
VLEVRYWMLRVNPPRGVFLQQSNIIKGDFSKPQKNKSIILGHYKTHKRCTKAIGLENGIFSEVLVLKLNTETSPRNGSYRHTVI